MTYSDMEIKAIEALVGEWETLVRMGEFEPREMLMSLEEQASMSARGWDCSAEEMEDRPWIAEMVGIDTEDPTDDQMDRWQRLVTEAARTYVDRHSDLSV